ncbi:MAG: DnaJ domain-containing protein [Polyangiaceae bacterium]
MKVGKNEAKLDVHAILGISANATNDEVRRAYRRLVAKHHPDRCHPEDAAEAERQMKLINVAAAILLNPDARSAYERLRGVSRRAGGPSSRAPFSPQAWPEYPQPRAHKGGYTKAPEPSWWATLIERSSLFLQQRPWVPFVIAASATVLFGCAAQWSDGPVPVASARYEVAPIPHFKTVFEPLEFGSKIGFSTDRHLRDLTARSR